MMTRTAGGPGSISPIDFNERRAKPGLNRNTWIAIGVVTLAHIGVGVVLYQQKFELKPTAQSPDAPPIQISMITPPKVIELLPMDPVKPVAPNPVIHDTPAPTSPTDVIIAVPGETAINTTTLTFDMPVLKPVEDVAPARPQPRPPAVITRPRWASQPSAAQMTRAYPDRAITNGISGTASLNCLVSAAGTLSNCSVTSETPRGQGFGRAAGGLTQFFRMSPGTVDGQAIDGARVAFTVRFAVSD